MPGKVTFQGNALTLVGRVLKVGGTAPDFKVASPDLSPITLSDFRGKVKVITSFPSLDTPVCDLQVKEFNKQASGLPGEAVIIGISMDLPFAQKRFCEVFDIKNVRLASDYQASSFGINYGLLIKELKLLARSVLIIDKADTLRYVQLVPEITKPPDYKDALNNLSEVLNDPEHKAGESLPLKCKPCEGGGSALPKDKIEKLLAQHRGWELAEDRKLVKEFKFKDFIEAKYFLDLVAVIAEEQGHHPTITVIYNKVRITLTTHAAGGLTENDFIMSRIIDELGF
jgi:thiol peroxidase